MTLHLTEHARKRAMEMGLHPDVILQAVVDPEISWTSRAPGQKRDRTVAQRGDIAVVSDTKSGAIITVLHRTDDEYERQA